MKSLNPENTVQDKENMSEWKEAKLGDVCDLLDCLHKTPVYSEIGYPMVRVTDIKNGALDTSGCLKVSESVYKDFLKGYKPKVGDIIFSRVGSFGNSSIVKSDVAFCIGQNTTLIVAKDINPFFAFYYLISSDAQNQIYGLAGGSTQPTISMKSIREIVFPLPSLPEQTAIAEVLSSLDDKIDLLHRQNKTLEQLAEALFRQWFVEEAEESWEEKGNGSLGEYIKIQNGYAFKSKDFKENGYAGIIKIRNISMGSIDITNHDYVDKSVVENLDKKFKIKTGDFLIAMTGAEIGKIGIVEKTDKEIWLNQRVGKLEARVPFGDLIGYLALKSKEGQEHITNACAGSAQENISSTGIEEMLFASYNEQKVNDLGIQIQPLFQKIIFNQGQIRTLTQLRDSLLPKLMSGEVRLHLDFQDEQMSRI
ncbi:MAG: type I restriction endonuclease subunit S [Bacteroidota bacterium]|nr:MAG: type I restriction endonuclease subunit S [Bacteroidota bacterium]